MYIEEIKIQNLRVFAEASAKFQYPGRVREKDEREVAIPNLNLILGNNGAGKSSLLKAIAIAAMGPSASKFTPHMFVRRSGSARRMSTNIAAVKRFTELVGRANTFASPVASLLNQLHESAPNVLVPSPAAIVAGLRLGWQDSGQKKPKPELVSFESAYFVSAREAYDDVQFVGPISPIEKQRNEAVWKPVYLSDNPAFFTVGYGSTRRVDTSPNAATPNQKLREIPLRHQRIQSIFTDGYPLVWLGHWLPSLKSKNPGRFSQVCTLLNAVLPDGIEFTAKTDKFDEYLFSQNGALVPFAALSDGCRAFIGWVADMLYHICFGCPSGVKLVDNCGIVLVDEIDLHLHPEWQRTVLPTLAKTFPNLQFIVTTHSPIVVGTLQRENIWVCETAPDGNGSVLVQKDIGVHGLSADQILLTGYFGLESSRAPEKQAHLAKFAAAAERKIPGKAEAFLKSLVTPMEDESKTTNADADADLSLDALLKQLGYEGAEKSAPAKKAAAKKTSKAATPKKKK